MSKFIAQDNEECQPLLINSTKKFIVNDSDDWQFLFNANSVFSITSRELKIGVEFNKDTFDSIRLVSYYYDTIYGSISSLSGVTFKIYLVTTPTWTEQFIGAFNGAQLFNSYYFVDIPLTSMPTVDFFGGDTIMIEATGTRLGRTFKERIYANHLGIYDNVFRLRQDVDFLSITKQDL